MGIKGLMKIIADEAPRAIREKEMKAYFGRKVAIDASMSLYQFLIAVRTGAGYDALTNEDGEVTSHLQGIFHRTIRMMDNGVKPVYVFDGKPPDLKARELEKRLDARKAAQAALKEAQDADDAEAVAKYKKRDVRVTREQNAEVRQLLRLMGVPVVEAPSEAEATCAALCKAGLVFASATEDMDVLTFGTPKLLRHMTFSASRKKPIVEIDLAIVLEDMNLTMDQFIDLCVLCGCDYTKTIKGIGGKTALKLLRKHGDLKTILANLDTKRYQIPEDYLYEEAADLFRNPDVSDTDNLKLEWKKPDREGVIQFLVHEKGFSLDRVQKSLDRLDAARGKSSQKRLESFFGPVSVRSKKGKKPTPKKKATKKKPAAKKKAAPTKAQRPSPNKRARTGDEDGDKDMTS